MIDFGSIIAFIAVFILPMVPSVLLLYFLPPRSLDGTIEGAVWGISLKASGAVGAYALFVVIAAVVYMQIANRGPVYVDGAFTIQLIGDDDAIREFLDRNQRLSITFLEGNNVVAKTVGVRQDLNVREIVSEGFRFESRFENAEVRVNMSPRLKNAELRVGNDTKFKLTRSFQMNLTLQSETAADFVVPLELTDVTYSRDGRDAKVMQLFILENRMAANLSNIFFNPVEIDSTREAHMMVKRLPKEEKNLLLANWSRQSVNSRDAAASLAQLVESVKTVRSKGSLIGEDALAANELDKLLPRQFAGPGKPARFMFGMTPRVELGSSGVQKDEAVVVLFEYTAKDDGAQAKFKLAPEAQEVGRRFLYPTEHAVMAVHADSTLKLDERVGEILYTSRDGRQDRFGDVQSKKAGDNTLIFDFIGLARDSFIRIPVYWTKPQRVSADKN
jgi:hypothetical protein